MVIYKFLFLLFLSILFPNFYLNYLLIGRPGQPNQPTIHEETMTSFIVRFKPPTLPKDTPPVQYTIEFDNGTKGK